ncbi:sensor histidine kinase [Bacillus kwashiorkori]|uniref:sensor histidine kinase n=1 Tax=Bacillus kwashiorkori TaxID=1522318 RepID=UPI000785C28B|nr:sensor histidine kinase [Bacillus kwashiorkori]
MKKWLVFTQKASGISPYVWSIISILPFYFIFQFYPTKEIIIGLILTMLFFIFLRVAFLSREWRTYVWTGLMIVISFIMIISFQFIYFAFYIAYFNGQIKKRSAFLTLYIIHLVSTTIAVNYNVVMLKPLFMKQIPFIIIILIGVILLPFNIFNRKKQEQLEEKLEDANRRIAEFVKQEERQRIARDLHDTLGQKLSLIGIKSELASKIVYKNPEQAKSEMKDVHQTARIALNEVRNMVSEMRGIRVSEEIKRIKQLLEAANITFIFDSNKKLSNVSLYLENILSMCLKEAVTNIVKHSQATKCEILLEQTLEEIKIIVQDNGVGFSKDKDHSNGVGLLGMQERLEFVNGDLEITSNNGMRILMRVPSVVKDYVREG